MASSSKQCPKCGAAAFYADDLGYYCTSCGWKDESKTEVGRKPSSGYIPGAFTSHDSAELYTPSHVAPHFFNLGAFLMPVVWCMGMRMWGWAVALVLIPFFVLIFSTMMMLTTVWAILKEGMMTPTALSALWSLYTIPMIIVAIFQLGASFYLGAEGSSMAWESRPFETEAEFRSVQKMWAIVGVFVFLVWAAGIAGVIKAEIGPPAETPQKPDSVPYQWER